MRPFYDLYLKLTIGFLFLILVEKTNIYKYEFESDILHGHQRMHIS